MSNNVAFNTESSETLNTDRTHLVLRARQFLLSSQVRNEDESAKRRFLQEKGLSESEIASLLQEERGVALPNIPPRTYPRPPPSSLPVIMAGVLRIMMWGAGAGAALILLYCRLILPRLTRSANARRSLKHHQRDLLSRLTASAQELRDTQRESFAGLPQSTTSGELPPYMSCKALEDVLSVNAESTEVPPTSLLRCALADLVTSAPEPTTEQLFEYLYSKIPWLEGAESYREQLWQTLNESARFKNVTEGTEPARWVYVAPSPSPATPAVVSVENLSTSLKRHTSSAEPRSYRQHTLQALADFTGYLTTQTYSLASHRLRIPGVQSELPSSQEEDVRKEIRALKGLVLNRKSFLPPRAISTTS